MATLSNKAAKALYDAVAQSGKHKGMLKAKAPPASSLAYAAWQGAQMVCNPYKVSIAGMMWLTDEQREVMREVEQAFEAIGLKSLDRDRNTLEHLGAW